MKTWWWTDGELHRMRDIVSLEPDTPGGIFFPQNYLEFMTCRVPHLAMQLHFKVENCCAVCRLSTVCYRMPHCFCPRAWNSIALVASQCSHIVDNNFQQLHYSNSVLGVYYHCIYYAYSWGCSHNILYFFLECLNSVVIKKKKVRQFYQCVHSSVYPFSVSGSPSLGVTGLLVRRSLTRLQFAAGTRGDKQPVSFASTDNLLLLISRRCMSLRRVRKPDDSGGNCANAGVKVKPSSTRIFVHCIFFSPLYIRRPSYIVLIYKNLFAYVLCRLVKFWPNCWIRSAHQKLLDGEPRENKDQCEHPALHCLQFFSCARG